MTRVIEDHLLGLPPQAVLLTPAKDNLANIDTDLEAAKSDPAIDQLDPIDADLLLTRCFGKPAFACLLLDQFEVSVPLQLEAIRRQLQHHDLVAVAEVAHSLKGAAGILCAESVWQFAAQVEGVSRCASLEELAQTIDLLVVEVQRCLRSLPTLRNQISLKSKQRSY